MSAPFSGLIENGRPSQYDTCPMNPVSPSRAKFVCTYPGCIEFDVTPVPWSRRASSLANMMFASFERQYCWNPR